MNNTKPIYVTADEKLQVELRYCQQVLQQFDSQLNKNHTSTRSVITRAVELYVQHLDGLMDTYNTIDKSDMNGRADIRYESMALKQTNDPMRKPAISMETMERHGVVAEGKVHTLRELGAVFNKPKKVQLPKIPRWMMTDFERDAMDRAYQKRKAKREAKARNT